MGYAPLDMRDYTPHWTIEVTKRDDGLFEASVPAQPKLLPIIGASAREVSLAQQDAIMTFINSDQMERRTQV